MPKVWVPSPMRDVTGGQHTLEVPGRTVREVLANLVLRYPEARERLLREDGKLLPHLVLLAGDVQVDNWDMPLEPDSELVITAALGGGGRPVGRYPAVRPDPPQ
ncbi:MAG: MoaD/ThiS family protein [Limnochordales bacterium]